MNSPQQQIQDAVYRHDASALRRILEDHPELRARIDEPAFAFDAPAIVACANDLAMVDVLLEYGADPNRRSDWWAGGFHALYHANGAAAERLLAGGAIPDACAAAHLDMTELLAHLIADNPQCVHERGGDGQTPLHFATSRDAVDLLLAAGADIDARDVDHRSTPAQWMLAGEAGAGRYELARYLVERGAATDIFLAAALGLTDRVRALLQADPQLMQQRTGRGEYGEQPPSSYHIYFWTIGDARSPLEVAAQFGQRATADVMWQFATPTQRFLFACRSGDEVMAKSLLREHPEMIDSMTADDQRAITDAAWNGDARAVALMLDLGFDPRTPGHDAGTALHCAAWQGSTETVAALLQHPEARELVALRDAQHNGTPLGWCCHGSMFGNPNNDHAGVARLLLDAGAPRELDMQASESVRAVLAAY